MTIHMCCKILILEELRTSCVTLLGKNFWKLDLVFSGTFPMALFPMLTILCITSL